MTWDKKHKNIPGFFPRETIALYIYPDLWTMERKSQKLYIRSLYIFLIQMYVSININKIMSMDLWKEMMTLKS
jgi:hypothetical protein